MQLERPLPQNADAERAILGAILLGHSLDLLSIRADQFFVSQHCVIFRCMSALFAKGTAIDLLTLSDALKKKDQLETAGGGGYISSLVDGVPRVSNVGHYVRIVIQNFQLRQRAYTAQKILDLALAANGNAAEALKEIGVLSAHLKEEVGQDRILNFRTGAEIAMATNEKVEWIVPGFVAKGGITELGAKVKIGKTTLILKLVRAVADGVEFLGNSTLRTSTVYLTEQPMVSFRQAMDRAGLLGRADFHVLEYTATRGVPWTDVVAEAVGRCKREGAQLLVIDTLPQFAGLRGDSENNSGDALAAMEPLLHAAAEGIAIILVRHERKSGGEVGDSGRGSSAFAGAADIVLSLRRSEGNANKTRRVLHGLSRFSETPNEILIELTEKGYELLGDAHEVALKAAKESILGIAPDSEVEAMDVKELIESAEVPRATAQRAIKELQGEGALQRAGNGKKGSPYKYFLSEIRSCPTSDIRGQKESGEARSSGAMS